VQLERWYDLIPSVVQAAKRSTGHERGVLDAVVAARSQAMAAKG